MATYAFRCHVCGDVLEVALPVSEYIASPPALVCCSEPMQRHFQAMPALARYTRTSDAIYDGLRAQDGTDISTRSKHRQYMKARGLTTVDDYKDTWAKQARERAAAFEGADPSRKGDIAQAIERLGG